VAKFLGVHGVWDGGDWHFQPFTEDVQVGCCGNSVCPPLA
jgi:DNA (cytosine-5)-methyltransferase 1